MPTEPGAPTDPDGAAVPVLSVVDGDTIHALVDGQDLKVRIIGIDTPETNECGFDSATAAATAVLGGQTVKLTADPSQDDRDQYDRLLRYVTLPDGQDFGNYMLAGGFAYEYTFDARYAQQDDYRSAQAAAAAASLGLWAGSTCSGQRTVPVDTPSTPAAAPPTAADSGATGDCDIKGNISDNGQIYHVPGSRDYEKTKINEAKGERWFCSIAEAEAAGWRAPRNG